MRSPSLSTAGEQPQLLLLSSDESTAFTLHLRADKRSLISLSSDGLNEAVLDE